MCRTLLSAITIGTMLPTLATARVVENKAGVCFDTKAAKGLVSARYAVFIDKERVGAVDLGKGDGMQCVRTKG